MVWFHICWFYKVSKIVGCSPSNPDVGKVWGAVSNAVQTSNKPFCLSILTSLGRIREVFCDRWLPGWVWITEHVISTSLAWLLAVGTVKCLDTSLSPLSAKLLVGYCCFFYLCVCVLCVRVIFGTPQIYSYLQRVPAHLWCHNALVKESKVSVAAFILTWKRTCGNTVLNMDSVWVPVQLLPRPRQTPNQCQCLHVWIHVSGCFCNVKAPEWGGDTLEMLYDYPTNTNSGCNLDHTDLFFGMDEGWGKE